LSGALMMLYLISASHEMAFNDQLTQLPGRHALEIDLRSPGRKFAIAMVDIDHFKSFNDSYGHDTGDDVLKLVASRIRLVKGKAKIYRYGGEEFTILFKGKTAEQAKEYLEQIRQDIEQYDLVIRDSDSRPKDDKYGATKRSDNRSQSVNITISVGVCDSSLEKRAKEAIKRADEALYQAKKAGRNRIKIASYS
jgi:diguanylate cyclase (GGDEF)-like protein